MKKIILLLTILSATALNGMENNESHTPSYLSSEYLSPEIFTEILGHCLPHEKNILMRVCSECSKYIKNRELMVGVNPLTVNLRDKTKSMFNYIYSGDINKLLIWLKAGANINKKNILGQTLFHIACDNNDEKTMQFLVRHGAQIDTYKPSVHPLHEAVYKGNTNKVTMLLKLGANLNSEINNGFFTPLTIAIHEDHFEVAKLLIDAGADVNQATNKGYTPLLFAVATDFNTNDYVKLLIAAGADVNQASTDGFTPLHISVQRNNMDRVKILLAAKATITLENIHAAQESGNNHIAEFLRDQLNKMSS